MLPAFGFLLIVFFLSLFELTLLPLKLALVFVLAYALNSPFQKTLFLVFFAGLIYDLVLIQPLGFTSLFFLATAFSISLYSQKFQPRHPVFITLFLVLSLTAYHLLWQKGFSPAWLGFEVFFGLFLLKILNPK